MRLERDDERLGYDGFNECYCKSLNWILKIVEKF